VTSGSRKVTFLNLNVTKAAVNGSTSLHIKTQMYYDCHSPNILIPLQTDSKSTILINRSQE
jgi:hypothetical protein